MRDLHNKKIWIIGASSGIGAALAQELSLRGACVALSARRLDELSYVHTTLSGDGHLVYPMDVSIVKDVQRTYKYIQDVWSDIDSVVFMAAIYSFHSPERKSIDFIHRMIDVNLKGAMTIVETVYPAFRAQGHGQIALCGSIAGYRGLPNGQPYCAGKAAIINYAESLKIEMEPYHIDVKVINPGFVKTPLTDKNDFPMPMIISATKAACVIADGLRSNCFEIDFPKRMTYVMKFLRHLPNGLYFMIARIMRRRMLK